MLQPVLAKLKYLRSGVSRCDTNYAIGVAFLVRLSDSFTKYVINGGGEGAVALQGMLGPEGYLDLLSGARIAPVSIVSGGAQRPATAALTLEVTEETI